MIEYRIYTKRAASKGGSMRLVETVYNQASAEASAARIALKGEWVKIITKETAEPSRWD